MSPFTYRGGELHCGPVSLRDIAAEAGTPVYVYSASAILERFLAYERAFADAPHLVCYAVKANGNLAVLKLLADAGAGFDIVSGGELFRVLKAGGDPSKVVFSGVGKTADEMALALRHGIHSFNCESLPELELLSQVASSLGSRARVAIRVNPDVDAATHPYISTGLRQHKFGIDIDQVERTYHKARLLPALLVEGVSCHIGSQILDTTPIEEAAAILLTLVEKLRAQGFAINALDLGGGLGVPYQAGQQRPEISAFAGALRRLASGAGLTLMVEPGRSIVAEAGVLLTRVLYRKSGAAKEFVIVDAGMNDLIRPALYQAHHEILPVAEAPAAILADIVGPVCETGDFLAHARSLPDLHPGDLLAVATAGAYAFAQASNYNSRPRPAEVLVEENSFRIVRRRETYDDLIRGETVGCAVR